MEYLYYIRNIIQLKTAIGRRKTANAYQCAYNRFKEYLAEEEKRTDIPLDDIDGKLMQRFEHYLLSKRKITRNSSSAYLRPLRAAYNLAVYDELCPDRRPFRKVYTGIDKTEKRAVNEKTLLLIASADLSTDASLKFTRDLFIFSFLTRGMAFVDIANLSIDNIKNNHIIYRRSKTKQHLSIELDHTMKAIIDCYHNPLSSFLFPILKENEFNQNRYNDALHKYNKELHRLSKKLNIGAKLTSYVARHTWASIAHKKQIPISVISESMGHNSEKTTRIYLDSFAASKVDKANALVVRKIENKINKTQNIHPKQV